MAYFDPEDLDDLAAYQRSRTEALKKITEEPVFFVYSSRHEFSKPARKTVPIFIFDKSKLKDEVVKAVKAEGSVAEGTCRMTKDKTLVFRVAKGTLNDFNMYKPFQIGEALATERENDDTAIDLPASKLKELVDMLARQKKRLETARAAKDDLDRKLEDVKASIVKLNADAEEKIKAGDADAKKGKEFLAAAAAARDALRSAAEAQKANADLVKVLTGMLAAADKAATPKEKVDVLFEKGKFGEAIKELEGSAYKAMMATDDAIMVLGRTEDTWALHMTQAQQARALSVKPELYSLPANDAFMKGGIDIKARFRLLSSFTSDTIKHLKGSPSEAEFLKYVDNTKEKEPALWNTRSNSPAVSAREVAQLLADGYWFGVYPKDPKDPNSALVQMMFPKALKADVHKELLTVFAKMRKTGA
ncbi:MAG: hypothetical protein ABI699_09875 [Caldimonas sp.]